MAQETLAGSAKQNLTDKNEKRSRAINASSMIMSKVKSTNSSTERSEHIPDTKGNLESSDNKKKDLKNSVDDAGKIGKIYLSHIEHEATQHASGSDDKRNETKEKTNGDPIPNHNVSNGVTQSHSGVTQDVQEKANKQIPGEHAKQNTELFRENDKNSRNNTESRNNSISSTLVNNSTHKRVSDKTNEASNKTGKTRVLETLKVNFLKSHWDQNNASNSQGDALETKRNVKLDNETNSKANSGEFGASSESTPAVGSDKKRASVLDKKNANLQKAEVVPDGTSSQQIPKSEKEISSTKGIDHNASTRTRTTTSAKSEKIVVNLSGKEEKSKKNKTNITITSRNDVDKVDKDIQQKDQRGKIPERTQLAKTDLDAHSLSFEIKSSVVQSNEQKVNSSFTNTFHKRADSTTSLTTTNVQYDHKHLKQLQNGPVETSKNTTLDSSKANKTVPKENTQVTKKDIIPSEKDSERSQNHNASSERDMENVRTRNALGEISKQPVDKMMDKVNATQDVDGLGNSRNDLPKKRLENVRILSTNTVERMNNSQGGTSNGKRFKKVKEDVEFHNLQRHPAAGHDHFKKGMYAPYCHKESFLKLPNTFTA